MDQQIYRAITQRNPRRLKSSRVLLHIAIDAAFWAALAGLRLWSHSLAVSCLIGALFAAFSFRSFGMMHDCVHSAGLSNRHLNNFLGWVYGVFSFLPFFGWQKSHLDHHQWTGNIEKDPAMKILVAFQAAGFKAPKIMGWTWKLWLPLFGFMQHIVFWRASLTRREFPFLLVVAFYLGLLGYGFGAGTLLAGLLSYLYLVEAINLPHHLGMTQYAGERRFHTFDQHVFARSCAYPRWIAHAVLLNFNLHTEHHLFPAHPWYQLDAIHDELVRSGVQFNFSVRNEWVIANRKHTLDEVLSRSFSKESNARAA